MADRFHHFGEALRHYRETYQDRIRKNNPDMPRIRITALALIDCMERKGYSISSGAYSEIESGICIPKDPRAFIEAAASCLAIEEGSPEWRTLVQQLGYDILAKKLGDEYATFVFREMGRTRFVFSPQGAGVLHIHRLVGIPEGLNRSLVGCAGCRSPPLA